MGDLNIDQNVDLQSLNTLAIPAKAAYCASCQSVDDLQQCVEFANKRELAILVLGEGSNTVFTKDYPGLVILNRLCGITVESQDERQIEIRVSAGEGWHHLVEYCIVHGWFGLENLALIPGLVGASPIQNIGAYGVEVGDLITSVDVLELESGEIRTLTNKECEFGYRDSVFKHELADKMIITAVSLRLSKVPNCNLSYPALSSELGSDASPKQVFEKVCQLRAAKLPNPEAIPNAGSFFKNPVVSCMEYNSLLMDHHDLIGFKHGAGYKLAAAWLIERRGWKDKSIDGVKVHQQQALVMTNPERREGSRVLRLAHAIQEDIKKGFGVSLEIEPRLY